MLSVVACDQEANRNIAGQQSTEVEKPDPGLPANANNDNQVSVTILEFSEVESGVDPYITRMLVSSRYIRIDEGVESDGYVLFDRLKKRIFSVVYENESILVVDPIHPLQAVPDDLEIKAQLKELDDAPTIAGVQPAYYQFHANGTLCYHLVAADGLLPEITRAMQDYQSILAAQQQETLALTPAELQTPCFLANYIYAPSIYITKGFPIEQWDVSGYRRSLISIKEGASVSSSIFSLPDSYEYLRIGGGSIRL
ncbi:MAG: hypothetical protein OQL16_05285 [Gammaproteobacteria bacterium]|nr:hypothetical protein [Gammaproteobacteria bacterium]